MKTIIYKKINNFNIITNISEPVIDPVETQKIISKKILETDEYKKILNKQNEIKINANLAIQSKISSRKSKSKNEKDKHWNDFLFRFNKMKSLEKEIENLLPNFEQKRKSLIIENAIYFETKLNEKIITDKEAENIIIKMQEATQNNSILNIDLNIIEDNRNKKYWTKDDKWKKTIVSEINISMPDNAILEKDLIQSQKIEIKNQLELERISGLSIIDKENEKNIVKENALSQAANMKSKLEIQGITSEQALNDSKIWYNEQVQIIEEKYN